jgi:xanthine dehydrogenase YagS FAD-binding subunit
MCVAMTALEARIHIQGASGDREVAISDFYQLPADSPHLENVLQPGDLITYVILPPPTAGTKSVYLKLRDRDAYEFALASAAVIVNLSDGQIKKARVALGGVGTKPWRSPEAEHELLGKSPAAVHFRAAAEAALRRARPQTDNGFKIELAKRCIVRALLMATANT